MLLRYLDGFLTFKKDFSPGFLLRGEICEIIGDISGAAAALQTAFALDPTNKQIILQSNNPNFITVCDF